MDAQCIEGVAMFSLTPLGLFHPAWRVMVAVNTSIVLSSITLPIFHPYIDALIGEMLREYNADV